MAEEKKAGILQGRVAVVTGGSAGIGRAAALTFAREGARVVVADVSMPGGEETVAGIRNAGGDAVFVKTDVSQPDSVEAMFIKAQQNYDRIDCAFNNAGIEGEEALTAECSLENFNRTMEINLRGVWLCMKHELALMQKRGGGAIVNTSSVAGMGGFAGLPAYTASKHGIVGLTRTAALEYAKQGIRVNAVCPGVIRTAMIDRITKDDPERKEQFTEMEPMGRMGKPGEIAEAVIWLCSDAASFVTGAALAVDGGMLAAT